MNCFRNIMPEYSYSYFDAYNQLQVKELNIFQCFVRKAFGCYAETHLSNVVKKAYTVTLNDQFQASPRKQQELLRLIAKAESILVSQFYMNLSSCNLSNGKKVNISVCYNISKPENAGDSYKISSIGFKLIFSRNDRVEETYKVSIFKNKSQQIVVDLPPDLFQREADSIQKDLNRDYAKTISELVAKILNDTTGIAAIQYYAIDYRWQKFNLFNERLKESPENLNSSQKEAMKSLEWDYQSQFIEQGQTSILDVKRVYVIRKEAAAKNQKLATVGFNQQLSITLTASLLETRACEYYT